MYNGSKAKGDDFTSIAQIEVGYDIFISDKVFLEPAVLYQQGLSKAVKKTSVFGLSFGIGIVL